MLDYGAKVKCKLAFDCKILHMIKITLLVPKFFLTFLLRSQEQFIKTGLTKFSPKLSKMVMHPIQSKYW